MTSKELDSINLANIPVLILGKVSQESLIDAFKIDIADSLIISEPAKISDIRELIHFLSYTPARSKIKLAVIIDADKMTSESANALLKTLEEPPEYAKIILTTRDPHKILPTIMSRCRKIRISLAPETLTNKNYLPPDDINKMTVAEKFKWAAQTAELGDEQILDIFSLWQEYYQKKLLSGEDSLAILKEIAEAKDLLRTNISVKLLLENILLQF
jgi:DNA polymerase III delta prime subunit